MGTIHFIWAGGEKPMPVESILCVREWRYKNPHDKIFVWIDFQTIPSLIKRQYEEALPSDGGFCGLDVTFMDIRTLEEHCLNLEDEKTRVLCLHIYSLAVYEFSKLCPNFGASSDLFRYLILFLFGDANDWQLYVDHDVYPNFAVEQELQKNKRDALLLHPNSQGKNCAGNDAILCRERYNELLLAILKRIQKNYAESFAIKAKPILSLYNSEAREERSVETIVRTGPQALFRALWELIQSRRLDCGD